MESEKKSQTRQTTSGGVTINLNTDPTVSSSKPPKPQRTPKQSEDTTSNVETSGAQTAPQPIIHRTPQRIYNTSGNQLTATPLAATLFARFNPRFNNPQPAEYYTYTDNVYKRRGHI